VATPRIEPPGAQPVQPEPLPQPAPPKTQPAQPAAIDTPLTLSGIAWNKDSADRLAIINGQAIATGATVNGLVVEEILQDRVRLSNRRKSFELQLGKTIKPD
jgi:general secretion pathway protein B